MNPKEIGVFEAKTHLSEVLKRVKEGQAFYITNRGARVAELRPVETSKKPLTFGCARKEGFWMSEDFNQSLEDFKEYT